jgi:hypothetical protein
VPLQDDFLDHPSGQISLAQGKLSQATLARCSYTNNGKLLHTLKRSPAGFNLGNKEVSGSIETVISKDGMERNYFDLVKNGEQKQFRFEIPAATVAIKGIFTQVELEVPVGDAVKVRTQFIGKFESL